MTTPPYHHGNLANHALELALQTLREQGDGAISLRALARQIGVSGPAMYRHFRDRDSLLAELAVIGFNQLRDRMLVDDRPETLPALQRIGQAYIEFARAEPNLYRLMFGGSVLPKGEHPALDQAGREAFQVLEQTLARGQQAGELIDAPLPQLTASAWSLVHGFALLSIDGHLPGPEQAPRLTDAILEIFQKGARAPSSTQQQES